MRASPLFVLALLLVPSRAAAQQCMGVPSHDRHFSVAADGRDKLKSRVQSLGGSVAVRGEVEKDVSVGGSFRMSALHIGGVDPLGYGAEALAYIELADHGDSGFALCGWASVQVTELSATAYKNTNLGAAIDVRTFNWLGGAFGGFFGPFAAWASFGIHNVSDKSRLFARNVTFPDDDTLNDGPAPLDFLSEVGVSLHIRPIYVLGSATIQNVVQTAKGETPFDPTLRAALGVSF